MESAGKTSADASETVSAVAVPDRLKTRAEFVRVSKGRRFFTPAFALQAAPRNPAQARDSAAERPRFGLTITKKTGNAVERNRIRRRLRETLKCAPAMDAKPGYDYVIVAHREALARPFTALVADLERAVTEINAKFDKQRPQPRT